MIKTIYTLALGMISLNAVAQTTVYSEDFQNGLPIDYTIVDNDGLTPDASVIEFADAWISLVDPTNAGDTVMGSTSFFDPVGQADRWLITPAIALGTWGNFLYWDAKSHDPSYPDSYMVLASKTDAQLSSFTDTLISVAGESFEWNYRELNLSHAGLDGETVHIAFVNRTTNGFKLYIDSISAVMEDSVVFAGINEYTDLDVTIYPNPTNDVVNIKGSFDKAVVYDMTGNMIIETSNEVVDLSAYDSGVYLITVIEGDRVYRTRIIKQ